MNFAAKIPVEFLVQLYQRQLFTTFSKYAFLLNSKTVRRQLSNILPEAIIYAYCHEKSVKIDYTLMLSILQNNPHLWLKHKLYNFDKLQNEYNEFCRMDNNVFLQILCTYPELWTDLPPHIQRRNGWWPLRHSMAVLLNTDFFAKNNNFYCLLGCVDKNPQCVQYWKNINIYQALSLIRANSECYLFFDKWLQNSRILCRELMKCDSAMYRYIPKTLKSFADILFAGDFVENNDEWYYYAAKKLNTTYFENCLARSTKYENFRVFAPFILMGVCAIDGNIIVDGGDVPEIFMNLCSKCRNLQTNGYGKKTLELICDEIMSIMNVPLIKQYALASGVLWDSKGEHRERVWAGVKDDVDFCRDFKPRRVYEGLMWSIPEKIEDLMNKYLLTITN